MDTLQDQWVSGDTLPRQSPEQEGGWRQAPGHPSTEQEGSSFLISGTEGLAMHVSRGERVLAPGRLGPHMGTSPSATRGMASSVRRSYQMLQGCLLPLFCCG